MTEREHITGDFNDAVADPRHPYHELAVAMLDAYDQAAFGKGKERHANDLPFRDQHMQTLAHGQGHPGGIIYQVCKKSQEAERLPDEHAVRELLGAIVYAAGAVLFLRHRATQHAAMKPEGPVEDAGPTPDWATDELTAKAPRADIMNDGNTETLTGDTTIPDESFGNGY